MFRLVSSDAKVTIDGKDYTITRKMFTYRSFEKTVQGTNRNFHRKTFSFFFVF